MAREYTTAVLKVAPPAGTDLVLVDFSGVTSWANTGWVEVIPSTPGAITLLGICQWSGSGMNAQECEIDIGKGAAGSETVVGTMRMAAGGGGGSTWTPVHAYFPIPISNIGASTRVAVRYRRSSTGGSAPSNTARIGILYYDGALGTTFTVTANPCIPEPFSVALTGIDPATGWGSSAWQQIIASAAADLVIGGVVVSLGTTATSPDQTTEYEIDIGKGGAGSETVIATVRAMALGNHREPRLHLLRPLLDNVASGSRLAWRMRADVSPSAVYRLALLTYHKPL